MVISRTLKYLIVAGSAHEAKAWAKRNGVKRKDYKYASSPGAIEGITGRLVVKTGYPEINKNSDEINKMINMVLISGHCVRADLLV
jgi:hypothetical protein